MSNTQETLDLILRYLQDKYPDKYRHMTTELIHMQPYHKQIWAWYEALAYYKINHNYSKLEDAPEGIRWIVVMDGTRKNYEWVNGQYRYIQQLTKKECEVIYGDKVPGT